MRIAVCGIGKLGCPIAVAFAAASVPVMAYDIDDTKINLLNAGKPPVNEPDLAEYLSLDTVRQNLKATNRITEAVANSDACLFVAPTPSLPDGSFDHSFLLAGIFDIAREVARQRKRRYLFIVNSTVMPGFLNEQAVPVLRRLLGEWAYQLAYKPEFIALGTVIRDLHYPDLLLIGQDSEEAGEQVEALYRQMVFRDEFKDWDIPAKHMSLVEAELAKISLNCAVTTKISFANQVGLVARRLGADPSKILDAVGEDRRIGHAGLRPGLPFGGPCFPRDNRMFQRVADRVGERAPIAEATDAMNRRVLRSVLDRVLPHGDVGILGLAYKPGTAITDESAGKWWREVLLSRGRRVKSHDMAAPHTHRLEDVLRCATIIVACAWPEYAQLEIAAESLLIDPWGAITRPRAERLTLQIAV